VAEGPSAAAAGEGFDRAVGGEVTPRIWADHPAWTLDALGALLAEEGGCDPGMVAEHLERIDRELQAIAWLVREARGGQSKATCGPTGAGAR
jgi:hypothetical protein